MKDSELKAQGPPLEVDNTILSILTTCPRKTYWFLRGLDYKSTPRYFIVGRAFGAALNEWHTSEGTPIMERVGKMLNKAQEIWTAEAPEEPQEGGKKEIDSWETLKDTLLAYVDNYGEHEPWRMPYDKGEIGFKVPLPGTSVLYCGSIDAPIEWEPYGMLIREDKTTGAWINQGYLDQWDFSTQVTGYIMAAWILLGEPFGCYMNIAGKKPRKEPSDRFARYLTKRSQWQIDEFVRDTKRLIESLQREWDTWTWPKLGQRNPMNCAGGMGRSRCLYQSLCLQEADPWQLEEGFQFIDEFTWRGKWAPWERDGSDD